MKKVISFTILALLQIFVCNAFTQPVLRPARTREEGFLQRTLAKELMNPLNIDPRRFIIAEGDNKEILGFGQVRPLPQVRAYELSSLFVVDKARGRGVGSAIVNKLIDQLPTDERKNIYLLTLEKTTDFYTKLGFSVIGTPKDKDAIPDPLRVEMVAGSALQSLFGNTLVCMQFGAGGKGKR